MSFLEKRAMRKMYKMEIDALTMKIAKNKFLIRKYSGKNSEIVEKLEDENEYYFSKLKDLEVQ